MSETLKDWKLKLRYGKLITPYKHFTIIAPVLINDHIVSLNAAPGKAYIGIKMWALDINEATKIIMSVAKEFGFTITGKIEVYSTDAQNPPKDEPYAYDLNFSYYQ